MRTLFKFRFGEIWDSMRLFVPKDSGTYSNLSQSGRKMSDHTSMFKDEQKETVN